jgi:hypothetical protein
MIFFGKGYRGDLGSLTRALSVGMLMLPPGPRHARIFS